MYLSFTIPIFQIIGFLGCLWSITIVLVSRHIGFIKTKYYYATVFASDIAANVFMIGIDKTVNFFMNFNPQFVSYNLTNNSIIICKLCG